jgi:hypothetical protein
MSDTKTSNPGYEPSSRTIGASLPGIPSSWSVPSAAPSVTAPPAGAPETSGHGWITGTADVDAQNASAPETSERCDAHPVSAQGGLDVGSTSGAGQAPEPYVPNVGADAAESTCGRCCRVHGVIWSAPSGEWNAVMRKGGREQAERFGGMICPTCFMQLADAEGIAPVGFSVAASAGDYCEACRSNHPACKAVAAPPLATAGELTRLDFKADLNVLGNEDCDGDQQSDAEDRLMAHDAALRARADESERGKRAAEESVKNLLVVVNEYQNAANENVGLRARADAAENVKQHAEQKIEELTDGRCWDLKGCTYEGFPKCPWCQRDASEAERQRLERIIEEAPHGRKTGTTYPCGATGRAYPPFCCDCWKLAAQPPALAKVKP